LATSLVSNVVKDLSGVAVPGVFVVIELIPQPAFRQSDGSEIAHRLQTVTDNNGSWSVALERSININPLTAIYKVTEYVLPVQGGPRSYYFTIPGGDTALFNVITVPNLQYASIQPYVCTSATRPSAPYVGMSIFETDTGKVLYYYGSTLTWQPDWGTMWGEKFNSQRTSNSTTTSTSYVDLDSLAFTNLVTGRQYALYVDGLVTLTGGATTPRVGFAITDNANAILEERIFDLGVTAFTDDLALLYRFTANGSLTLKSRIKMANGTGTAGVVGSSTQPFNYQLLDTGPSANPVIT